MRSRAGVTLKRFCLNEGSAPESTLVCCNQLFVDGPHKLDRSNPTPAAM